jgi:hypothetical protein
MSLAKFTPHHLENIFLNVALPSQAHESNDTVFLLSPQNYRPMKLVRLIKLYNLRVSGLCPLSRILNN